MSRKIEQLVVYVHDGAAGTLASTPGLWTYTYRADAAEDVALSMPREVATYSDPAILPPFEQCLPEMDASLFPPALWKFVRHDSMGLLWAAGKRRLGRLRFSEPGESPERSAGVSLSRGELASIDDGDAFFMDLVSRLTFIPGVAGVQPKTLASINDLERAVTEIDTHIVKASRPEYPWLTVVEAACMGAAHRSGVPTCNVDLSGDGRLIAVERFDLADGRPRGFDEVCALQGRHSVDKYAGSYEAVIKTVSDFIPPETRHDQLLLLIKQLAFCYAIENGDAHLKNFGLVYDDPDRAALSPAYDLTTTTCFAGMERDAPALTLEGRKSWDGAIKALERVALRRALLQPVAVRRMFEELADGLSDSSARLQELSDRFPKACPTLERMQQAWTRGLDRLTKEASLSARTAHTLACADQGHGPSMG